jgi:hypothetical protein
MLVESQTCRICGGQLRTEGSHGVRSTSNVKYSVPTEKGKEPWTTTFTMGIIEE